MLTLKNEILKTAMRPILCAQLKQHRKKKNLTQEEMARIFMISVRSYADLEHGVCFPSALTFALFLTQLEKEEQKELLDEIRKEIEKVK